MIYRVKLTFPEAVLLDHMLTLHQYDPDLLGRLTRKYAIARDEVGRVLCEVQDSVELESGEEFDEILAMVPILFAMAGENVGLKLKQKLWRTKLGIPEPEPDLPPSTDEPDKPTSRYDFGE